MSDALTLPAVRNDSRPIPAVQRAYLYVVALVAIHMIVLAVANLLRVGAELAMNAPSGGFTGLPFLFAEFSRPRELYREQASLAIALFLVGAPAWWLSFRAADRAARRDGEARASAIRSFYVHLVIFVTALLVFGYGQRTLLLILQGGFAGPLPFGFVEPEWQARAAGAAAMAITAAGALAYHVRVSLADRRATLVAGRAAELRQTALYALAVIGLLFASFSAAFTLQGLWDRLVADALVPITRFEGGPFPGQPAPSNPDDLLRFRLLGQIPPIVAGLALWLATWLPLQRSMRGASADADVERRSVVRKLAVYFVVGLSAIAFLIAATFGFAAVIRRLLGDPFQENFTSLVHDLGFPVGFTIVFATLWLFHRRVVEAEAARETELARGAIIRRLYTYLVAAIGLAMMAIGVAGTIGVAGSQLMGMNTHQNGETGAYLSLVLVGLPAWAFHWWQAQRRLDDLERRAPQRRGYLYLAVLGGALGLLVFGSAALYRLLNAALAADFPLSTWHDIWHFAVDAGVSGAAFAFHLAIVRADRAVMVPAAPAPAVFGFLVRLPGVDADAARARLAAAIPEARITPLRGDAPGAGSPEPSLTQAQASALESEGGPNIPALGIIAVVGLLLVALVVSFGLPFFFAPSSAPAPRAIPQGKLLWEARFDTGDVTVSPSSGGVSVVRAPLSITFQFTGQGRAEVTFERQLEGSFLATVLMDAAPGTDATLLWTIRTGPAGSVAVRANLSTSYADLVFVPRGTEITEVLSKPVPFYVGPQRNGPVELAVYVREASYALQIDGHPAPDAADDRLAGAPSVFSISVRGSTGSLSLHDLRAYTQ